MDAAGLRDTDVVYVDTNSGQIESSRDGSAPSG